HDHGPGPRPAPPHGCEDPLPALARELAGVGMLEQRVRPLRFHCAVQRHPSCGVGDVLNLAGCVAQAPAADGGAGKLPKKSSHCIMNHATRQGMPLIRYGTRMSYFTQRGTTSTSCTTITSSVKAMMAVRRRFG